MQPIAERNLRECVRQLYVFLRSGQWSAAQPRHFAALHGWIHKRVMGEWPPGYSGMEFSTAALRAGRLMRDAFMGDPYDMADYIRWVWLTERDRLVKLRADQAAGRRLFVRKSTRVTDERLFSPTTYLLDYRRALHKRARAVEKSVAQAARS